MCLEMRDALQLRNPLLIVIAFFVCVYNITIEKRLSNQTTQSNAQQ